MRRSGRRQRLTAAAVAVLAAGTCIGAWVLIREPAPVLNQAQARAMLPAITGYLQSPANRDPNVVGEFSAADYRVQRVKWLCAAELVEIRSDGSRWRVGMDVACGSYARQEGRLFGFDGGDMGYEVMILSGNHGHYQVLSAAQEPGVVPDPAWIDRNFSAGAAAEINGGSGPFASMPTNAALRAFGCTAGVRGSTISGDVLGYQGFLSSWPCRPALG